jgi:hypothetical protein
MTAQVIRFPRRQLPRRQRGHMDLSFVVWWVALAIGIVTMGIGLGLSVWAATRIWT